MCEVCKDIPTLYSEDFDEMYCNRHRRVFYKTIAYFECIHLNELNSDKEFLVCSSSNHPTDKPFMFEKKERDICEYCIQYNTDRYLETKKSIDIQITNIYNTFPEYIELGYLICNQIQCHSHISTNLEDWFQEKNQFESITNKLKINKKCKTCINNGRNDTLSDDVPHPNEFKDLHLLQIYLEKTYPELIEEGYKMCGKMTKCSDITKNKKIQNYKDCLLPKEQFEGFKYCSKCREKENEYNKKKRSK
jgi:hypothetical protein